MIFILTTVANIFIMIFPMINNRNRQNQGKSASEGSFEQFGLGIQVIKIQSNKTIDPAPPKMKKASKIISVDNPIPENTTVQTVKRTQVLPSLSTDKKSRTGGLSDTSFRDRKPTIEKKKPLIIQDSIKQFDDRYRPIDKKAPITMASNKNNVSEPLQIEKSKTHKHYKSSYNSLIDFSEMFQQRQADNLKQIKRLRKQKQNNYEVDLERQLKLRECKNELALDMAEKQEFRCFSMQEEFDEFNLSSYVDSGYKFKFQDVEPTFQY